LATFELIVVAAAFDRWRMRGRASGRSRTARGPTFPGERFPAVLVSHRASSQGRASKPYKARSVPVSVRRLEFKEPLSLGAH
jgi:hypothetical protein